MMGFRHEIIGATRGSATVNTIFSHYETVAKGSFSGLRTGKLVSMDSGEYR
jgi:predicted membrane GTPase involved in stress response